MGALGELDVRGGGGGGGGGGGCVTGCVAPRDGRRVDLVAALLRDARAVGIDVDVVLRPLVYPVGAGRTDDEEEGVDGAAAEVLPGEAERVRRVLEEEGGRTLGLGHAGTVTPCSGLLLFVCRGHRGRSDRDGDDDAGDADGDGNGVYPHRCGWTMTMDESYIDIDLRVDALGC